MDSFLNILFLNIESELISWLSTLNVRKYYGVKNENDVLIYVRN